MGIRSRAAGQWVSPSAKLAQPAAQPAGSWAVKRGFGLLRCKNLIAHKRPGAVGCASQQCGSAALSAFLGRFLPKLGGPLGTAFFYLDASRVRSRSIAARIAASRPRARGPEPSRVSQRRIQAPRRSSLPTICLAGLPTPKPAHSPRQAARIRAQRPRDCRAASASRSCLASTSACPRAARSAAAAVSACS